MLHFAISVQKVAMLRPSNIRQNCFGNDDPRLLHNEHATSIFMMKSHSDNPGINSWDTLVFSYTEVH